MTDQICVGQTVSANTEAYVHRFSTDGTLLQVHDTGKVGTVGIQIATDSIGRFYVPIGRGAPNEGWVVRINPSSGSTETFFTAPASHPAPRSVSLDSAGNAHILLTNLSTPAVRLVVLDPDGVQTSQLDLSADILDPGPGGLVNTSGNRFYVSGLSQTPPNDGVISRYNLTTALPDGVFAQEAISTFIPIGMRFRTSDAKLLVANERGSPVVVRLFAADGLSFTEFSYSVDADPVDCDFSIDDDTIAYASDFTTYDVYRVNLTSGVVSVLFNTGFSNTLNMPITVVPAPSDIGRAWGHVIG